MSVPDLLHQVRFKSRCRGKLTREVGTLRSAQFTSTTASFESVLSILSSYFFVESDDALLRWIRKTLRMKDVRAKMRLWRAEWQGFVRDGTANQHMT